MMARVQSRLVGLAAAAGCALAIGCAHTTAPPPSAAPPTAAGGNGGTGDIYVSTDVGPPEVIALWGSYGVALATAAEKLGHDDFAAELEARTFLADAWKKGRATSTASDPYLDTLAAVRDAGFMSEYVLAFLTREGWTISGNDLVRLDIAGFTAWAAAHLPTSHEAVTRVKVVLKAPTRPTVVPGRDLLRAGEIDAQHKVCANMRPIIGRAMADWTRQAQLLAAVPLSVTTRAQILPSLRELGAVPHARRDGVIFVSSQVLEVMFDAGFCEVDRGAWADAETLLREAVAVSPASTGTRSELVEALIMQQKLDEADAELERAIATSDSVCQTAILWRKRGYILFDRRKLVDSYHAYAKSLELDPRSELARNEMQLIVKLLHQTGTFDDKQLGQALGPPGELIVPGKMSVANCPR
jgi:tetratricopeptide (TPR) repeat protein